MSILKKGLLSSSAATALLFASGASAMQLNWDTFGWVAGATSGSQVINGVTVDVNLSANNGFRFIPGVPSVSTALDGLPDADTSNQSLWLQANEGTGNPIEHALITISFSQSVKLSTLNLFDVDDSTGMANSGWQDRVQLQSFLGAGPAIAPDNFDLSSTGGGRTNSDYVEQTDAFTLTSRNGPFFNADRESDASRSIVNFDSNTFIDTLVIKWDDGPTANNIDGHGIGIGDLTFETATIPEPSALALLGAGLLGFGIRKRRAR